MSNISPVILTDVVQSGSQGGSHQSQERETLARGDGDEVKEILAEEEGVVDKEILASGDGVEDKEILASGDGVENKEILAEEEAVEEIEIHVGEVEMASPASVEPSDQDDLQEQDILRSNMKRFQDVFEEYMMLEDVRNKGVSSPI